LEFRLAHGVQQKRAMAMGKHTATKSRSHSGSAGPLYEPVKLGAGDLRQLLEICVDVLELTSRVTHKLDPSYSTLVKLAQEEIELAVCYEQGAKGAGAAQAGIGA
jgi:hypothetical protein